VIVFPVISAVLAFACAAIILRDQIVRPRPDKAIWSLAFLMFGLAAGADAYGRQVEWSEPLARLYYATGPALVVMYLAIGELYLLFPRRMGRFAPGAAILLTAIWVTTVLNAPIDGDRLAEDGWEAIDRGSAMVALTIAINTVGTLVIVGGLAWSIWRYARAGTHRNRMIGCVLIASGTIVVGLGGTLTRLGHYEYLYIAMSIGIAMIFGGVIWTRRPESASALPMEPGIERESPAMTPASTTGLAIIETNAMGFVGQHLLTLDDDALDRFCTEWSVPRDATPVFARDEARRAWSFRRALSDEARLRFDAIPVPARRQIVELFDEVLSVGDREDRAISVMHGPE
jgi:hypothetical protein